MNFLSGYKLIIGASLGAITYFITGIESLLSPDALILVKAIMGALSVFFVGVGFAGKCDKMRK